MINDNFNGASWVRKRYPGANAYQAFNIHTFQLGDMFREAIKAGTPTRCLAQSYIQKGDLVQMK